MDALDASGPSPHGEIIDLTPFVNLDALRNNMRQRKPVKLLANRDDLPDSVLSEISGQFISIFSAGLEWMGIDAQGYFYVINVIEIAPRDYDVVINEAQPIGPRSPNTPIAS